MSFLQNCNYAAWNHQTDSGAMSVLPKLQLGSFPGWAPLPAKANSQRGEGSSPQYAHRRYLSRQLPETRVMKPSAAKPVWYDHERFAGPINNTTTLSSTVIADYCLVSAFTGEAFFLEIDIEALWHRSFIRKILRLLLILFSTLHWLLWNWK